MSVARAVLSLLLGSAASAGFAQCALPATPPAQGAVIDSQLRPLSVNPEEHESESGRSQSGNPLWAIPLKSLSATRDRPLFSPSRRPPAAAIVALPPPPPAAAAAAPEQLQLSLVGTVVGAKERMGVFVDQSTKAIVRLQVGEGISGWTLRDVQVRTAMFEKGPRETTLALPSRNGANNSQQEALPNPAPSPPAPHPDAQAPAETGQAAVSGTNAQAGTIADRGPSAGTWRDGDGQLISPPPAPVVNAAGTDIPLKSLTWSDGDGQAIAPPPSYRAKADGSLPQSPQLANWRDGDGRLIGPPSLPPQHGAGTWVDGDGQFVPAPLH